MLLVEDNELNREVALGLLSDADLSIDLAENGRVAVQMASAGKYDLVLMDMQMPVMDGIAATRAIRLNAELRTLPIIAMTANVMAHDIEQCVDAGMNDHVAKPIDPDALFTALLRWIKPRNAESSLQKDAPPVPSQPAPPTPSDSDPLEILGIDTKSALRRTGGNRRRYESLLRRFAEPSAGAVEEIRAALAAGDTSTAARAAHSLKGAAANLGAGALAELAARAETAVTTGQDVEEALHSLAVSYEDVARAINSALPAEQFVAAAAAPADLATVVEPLTRLKILLKNDDGDAADYILEARPSLSKVLTEAEINTLTGLVGNFNFEAALISLSDIADRLFLTLE